MLDLHPGHGAAVVRRSKNAVTAYVGAEVVGHPLGCRGDDVRGQLLAHQGGFHRSDPHRHRDQVPDDDAGRGAPATVNGDHHSRTDHGESDTVVRAKAEAAHRADLSAIVCLGETEAERDADETLAVVGRQLADSLPEGATPENTVVAYEPVWAIGTGRTPSEGEISVVHRELRDRLVERFGDAGRDFRLLYGGSVKPDNAVAIMKLRNVDGGLIGGASLKAEDFWPIVEAC